MWAVLLPLAAFLAALLFGAVALWYIAKHSRITQTETAAGKGVHVESFFGWSVDSRPEATLDPRLARLPSYPGALRNEPAADVVTELDFGRGVLREVSATYWTPDPEETVWQFFRRELPDWPCNLVKSHGKELIHPEHDGVRLIRVTRQSDRTIIETCIKPPGYPNLLSD